MTQVIKNINEIKRPSYYKSDISKLEENQLNDLINSKTHHLSSGWTLEVSSATINTPHRKFYLTKKELLFIQMLLKNTEITTYDEMIKILWNGGRYVTLNAVRLFTKDLKKKLPPKTLRNFQDIGYKLIIN